MIFVKIAAENQKKPDAEANSAYHDDLALVFLLSQTRP
jgi:hypothetical protein